MGSYTKAVYTAEQMARLGVDEDGKATAVQTTDNSSTGFREQFTVVSDGGQAVSALGAPPSPLCATHGMPRAEAHSCQTQPRAALRARAGPSWTRGGAEAPAGERDMGSYTKAVYTAEQMARLGVDEDGEAASSSITA